ncbi:hypothetical protein RZS08_48025, partial [Arthrospira platensis SPKY1]|nr:hypothetical protein [Arthrospira platensis SPKY1]
MKTKILILAGLPFLLFLSCQAPGSWEEESRSAEWAHRSMKKLTDVIVHDIFSPPVASRIYAYASIAGYEALLPAYPGYETLAGQLNEL